MYRYNQQLTNKEDMNAMLLGPVGGEHSTLSLGFGEFFGINNVSVLGEIAYEKDGFSPEVSFVPFL